MGLLDWLLGRKTNVEVLEDRIWLTKQAKFSGISKAVRDALADRHPPTGIVLVAHFADCLAQLQKLVDQSSPGPLSATLAGELSSRVDPPERIDESRIVEIIAAERHPLAAHDEALLQFARSQPCRCRLVYHVSLEDPLMQDFAGEWVENMLRQLGMQEDEAIESRMVGRRIKAAQRALAGRASGDRPAESAQEWIAVNCRR